MPELPLSPWKQKRHTCAFTLAPNSRRHCTVSSSPQEAAKCKGVCPSLASSSPSPLVPGCLGLFTSQPLKGMGKCKTRRAWARPTGMLITDVEQQPHPTLQHLLWPGLLSLGPGLKYQSRGATPIFCDWSWGWATRASELLETPQGAMHTFKV